MSPLGLRLAWRELRAHRGFTCLFIANLALGLVGFTLLDSFKAALNHSLDQRSRELLSADLAISCRRPLTAEELRDARTLLGRMNGAEARESPFIAMYTMARHGGRSRLVELDAFGPGYPFYGKLEASGGSPPPVDGDAWIDPELGIQLGLKPGDSLDLGQARLKVADLVSTDTTNAWRGFSLASRIYVPLSSLERTGLIRKGSTVTYTRFFGLKPGTEARKTAEIARALDHALKDPAIRVRTDRQASEEVARLIHYLDDFLGLVALVALFLSCLGSAYLFRSYLAGRIGEIAILESLGASPGWTRRVYLLQLTALGALAGLGAVALGAAVLPALSATLHEALPFQLDVRLPLRTAALVLALGIAGSLLICLPLLRRLKGVMPGQLFQESAAPSLRFSPAQLLGVLPPLGAFWGLAVWLAHSWMMGSLFVGLVLGSAALLAGGGSLLLACLGRVELSGSFVTRLALRSLRRSRLSSLACFIGLGLGTLLLNLVPEIQGNIRKEFTAPEGLPPPSLFLFDIQPEQANPLREYLKSLGAVEGDFSPLIRSRLDAIDGKPFEKAAGETGTVSRPETREEEEKDRFRNRGFNLTYRDGLQESESLVKGRLWTGPWEAGSRDLPQVSVEQRFAERLGIRLGDTLDFDVQGVPVQARVTSLRRIRWSSFQPNFFVLFQPGALEDAPRTWLTTLSGLNLDRRVSVQNGVVERFPNVSMIDVSELVTKLLAMFRQLGQGIQAMAWLSLGAGLAVLFSIASHEARAKGQESNLLKILGARFSEIRGMVRLEFGILGLLASALGALLSYGVSYILSVEVFDGVWAFTWRIPLASVGGVALLSVVVSSLATRRVLARRPVDLLLP